MRLQRQVVDYALRRRALLAEVYSGRTGVSEVCDANPYLLRAAKFHGKPSQVMCPICRKEQLTLVSWVFGEHLGAVSGSARTAEELVLLATRFAEFAVHVVEVCRTCSWNHLVKSYVLGADAALRRAPRGRRATAPVRPLSNSGERGIAKGARTSRPATRAGQGLSGLASTRFPTAREDPIARTPGRRPATVARFLPTTG